MKVLNKIQIKPYGYSHSDVIGFKMNGIKSGYEIDFDLIDNLLIKRKGSTVFNTRRDEKEQLIIKSGFNNMVTNGDQIWIEINQNNFKKKDYEFGIVRPGHVDLSAYQKYGSNWQFSGGGQFSGRLTILYVIAGEIARQVLKTITSLEINGHVAKVGTIKDELLNINDLKTVENEPMPIINPTRKAEIEKLLKTINENGDSVGGQLDIYVRNIEKSYGSDFFESLESKISYLMYSIPGVKAIEFGIGTDFSNKKGSEVVEKIYARNGNVHLNSNYNGGINGGIANKISPIKFSVTIKPTSTIFKEIDTVKYNGSEFEDVTIKMRGRHDSFIANRALWPMLGLLYILFLDLELEDKC